MMYDYVTTKPELNDETLAHFLGGAHKYLKKYMGKNGKWVYVYNKVKGATNSTVQTTKSVTSQARNRIHALLPALKKKLNEYKPRTESYITNANTGERRKATTKNTPFTVKKKPLITTNTKINGRIVNDGFGKRPTKKKTSYSKTTRKKNGLITTETKISGRIVNDGFGKRPNKKKRR